MCDGESFGAKLNVLDAALTLHDNWLDRAKTMLVLGDRCGTAFPSADQGG